MKQHLEAYSVRKVNDQSKAIWTRVGTAFRNTGNNIVVKLDAIPAPANGQFEIVLLPPKEKQKAKD